MERGVEEPMVRIGVIGLVAPMEIHAYEKIELRDVLKGEKRGRTVAIEEGRVHEEEHVHVHRRNEWEDE